MRQGLGCSIFFAFLTFWSVGLQAQQPAGLTQFFVNPSAINPSYTGIDGRPAAFLGFRRQWSGLDGGPTIGYFNIQAPLPSQVLVGATLTSDKKGLVNSTSALLTGGYSVSLSSDQFLRFGMSFGAATTKVDLDKLYFVNQNDPTLGALSGSTMEVLGNVGVSFHTKSFHIGASMPTLFEPTYVAVDGFTFAKVKPLQSVVLNMSNRFYFAKGKNAFEPYLIYRLNDPLPSQFEVAGVLHLQNKVWLGGSFKQDFGISALGGIKLNNLFAVGYSYALKNTGDNKVSFPSHEIQLALLLGKHQKNTPMYSFVDTHVEKHKKTPKELLAEKQKREELLAKKNEVKQTPPKKEEPKKEVPKKEEPKKEAPKKEEPKKEEPKKEEPKKEVPKEEPKKEEPRKEVRPVEHLGGPRLKSNQILASADSVPEHEMEQHLHEQEILKRLDDHKDDPQGEHNEENHPNAERHDFVKRGDHPEEMNLADYVIVGAFRSKANAQHYDEQMVGMGFPEVHYGFLTARNLWYVYVASSNNLDDAKAARDKYRKLKMFKDAWLLTVHE